MFDRIENLKREYTDKYVVVDADRPELARFAGYTGQVKTVNMSGRALVQFEAWNNIGWYDIDVDFLAIVPKPEAGAAKVEHAKPGKPAAAKPVAGEKKVSAAELARAQGAAKPAGAKPAPATAGKKPSTADILAAARAGKAAAGGTGVAAGEAAPAKAPAAAPAAKPTKAEPGKKLSTAEILAAARAKKSEGELQPAGAPAAASPAAASLEPDATPHVTHEVGPEAPLVEPATRKTAATAGPLPTTTAEKIEWCRQHDANRAG